MSWASFRCYQYLCNNGARRFFSRHGGALVLEGRWHAAKLPTRSIWATESTEHLTDGRKLKKYRKKCNCKVLCCHDNRFGFWNNDSTQCRRAYGTTRVCLTPISKTYSTLYRRSHQPRLHIAVLWQTCHRKQQWWEHMSRNIRQHVDAPTHEYSVVTPMLCEYSWFIGQKPPVEELNSASVLFPLRVN